MKTLRESWLYRLTREVGREWVEDRCSGLAAEIAFFGLLGLFPTLLVLAAALGWSETFVGENAAADAEQWIVDRAGDVFGEESEVPAVLSDLFATASPQVFTLGVIVSLYTASRGFAAVVRGIDVAYDEPIRRGWFGARAVGLLLAIGTVLVGVFTLLVLVVGPFLGTGDEIADHIGGGGFISTVWDWFRWPIAVTVFIGWAATIYHLAPNQRSPWRWDLPGALLATFCWLVSTWGFTLYLDFASEAENALFGLLGGAITLLLWFYVLGMGLLVGAELNAVLSRWYDVGNARRVFTPVRDAVDWVREQADDEDQPDAGPDRASEPPVA